MNLLGIEQISAGCAIPFYFNGKTKACKHDSDIAHWAKSCADCRGDEAAHGDNTAAMKRGQRHTQEGREYSNQKVSPDIHANIMAQWPDLLRSNSS